MKFCPTMENTDLVLQETGDSQSPTRSRPAECHSRPAIQAGPDRPDRIVPPVRSLPSNILLVAPAPSRPVLPPGSTTNCLSLYHCARPPRLAVDGIRLPWEDLDPYGFPPVAFLGKWWRSRRTTRAR